jgi:NADPH-dependent glutamate synthase beta subunit-like oxidoreductase
VGKKIVVVGGGDVAMDSIRSSLRLSHGGTVTLVYRRSKAEMPADKEELHGAEKEGIHFEFLKAPLRVVGHDRVEGLVVQRMELGAPDAGGRRAPVPVPGSEEMIPCDTLIVAVGQKADLEGFGPELGLKVTSQGWPEGARPAFATDVPGIFAAGGRSVVYAMGTASQAAEAIDAYLSRKRGEASTARPDPFGGAESFHLPAGYTAPIRE